MDQPHRRGLAGADGARAVVVIARDPLEPGLDESGRHRQKADHIGDDNGGAGADHDQSRQRSSERCGERVQRVVDGEHRREQPERQHQPGQRVTQLRDVHRDEAQPARPPAPGQNGRKAEQQRGQRGKACERDRVEGVAPQRHVEIRKQPALETLMRQIQQRHQESEADRQQAGCECQTALDAGKRRPLRQPRAFGGKLRRDVAPSVAFNCDKSGHDRQHETRQLRGAGEAAAVEPGREHRDRERANAEIFAGADVVQRFQRHQRCADRERGTCHRQRDAPEDGPASGAERLRGLGELRALELEHRARRKIDVRIEHQRDHDDGAGQRAQIGKHAHRVLQRQPDRKRPVDQAERLEQIDIDVSREIGRDRERQRHQPEQHLPAAEFMQRDRPRRAGADRERQGADAAEQERGVEKTPRQHIFDEGLPDVRRRLQRQRDDGDDGSGDKNGGRDRDRRGDPARVRGSGHAGSHRQEAGSPCSNMPSPGEGEGMLAE